MINAMQKAFTEVVKEKVSEIRNGLGDKVPDFSKKIDSSNLESKTPAFSLTAKELNNNPDLQESEQKKVIDKSQFSESINESIKSEDELVIYQRAPLEERNINDEPALCRNDINLEKTDEMGQSNLERMDKGMPPLDRDGKPIELHHIGQKDDGPLAELSQQEHRGVGNNTILHDGTLECKINRVVFQKERSDHWKARAEQLKAESV